jgi:steroid delta-isomerase-like uncharacterized protein
MDPMEAQTRSALAPALTAEEQHNLASVSDVLPYWNRGDIPGVLAFYDPAIVWTNVAMEEVYRGHPGVGAYLQQMLTAFPDLRFEVSHKVPRGDRVAERWVISGTHLGPYQGIPATGKRVAIHGMSIVRLRDGYFLSDRFHIDSSNVMRSIGLFPPARLLRNAVGAALLGVLAQVARRLPPTEPRLPETLPDTSDPVPEHLTQAERENLQVVFDALEAFNRHDLQRLSELLDAMVRLDNKAGNEPVQGRDRVRADLVLLLDAFPDAALRVVQTVVRGNEVACEWVLEGTHESDFLGVPGTERRIALPGITMLTLSEQGIADIALYVDSGLLWRQLGLMPPLALLDAPLVRGALWAMVHPLRMLLGVLLVVLGVRALTRRKAGAS